MKRIVLVLVLVYSAALLPAANTQVYATITSTIPANAHTGSFTYNAARSLTDAYNLTPGADGIFNSAVRHVLPDADNMFTCRSGAQLRRITAARAPSLIF